MNHKIIELRKRLGKSQTEFWNRVGVTQSAGSRYETGRNIPKPVGILLEIAFGSKPYKIVAKIRGEQS